MKKSILTLVILASPLMLSACDYLREMMGG